MFRSFVTTVCLLLSSAALTASPNLPPAAARSDFPDLDADLVLLGRDLFYDPILSGNLDISCATCHHPKFGSADGVSLSIGTGGQGLGPDRVAKPGHTVDARIPRNAPALWNVGAYEYSVMFHDGRVKSDETAPFGIVMPEGRALEREVSTILAAQAILPILSPHEMAGAKGENPIADAVAAERIGGAGGAWDQLTKRVSDVPSYANRFAWVLGRDELHITDIGTALAAFMTSEFRATDSPFDQYLQGDHDALSDLEMAGMDLFYGDAGCASCHSGLFQTDHGFHAIGMPQLGPGKSGVSDRGRQLVTGLPEDRFRFRTPSLRNVTLTAPYGHAGSYATLEAAIRHHGAPLDSLLKYDRSQAILPQMPSVTDWAVMNDQDELIELAAAIELPDRALTDDHIKALVAFLSALTDETAAQGRLGVPDTVPSGLPVDR